MKEKKTLSIPVFCAVYVAVIIACVLLDQLTKIWIYDGLLAGGKGASVDVLGKFLQFTPTLNRGAAFGMGNSDSANVVFFIVTILGAPLFGYLLWRSRTRSVLSQIAFAFIIGGTIGNAIDRGFYATTGTFFSGGVRDFISFSIFPPIFNVADSFLTVGVFMAILAIVYFDPDSLIKSIIEERKIAQSAQNDQSTTHISTEQMTTMQGDVDENDTTNS